jgi:hypothetical protein
MYLQLFDTITLSEVNEYVAGVWYRVPTEALSRTIA